MLVNIFEDKEVVAEEKVVEEEKPVEKQVPVEEEKIVEEQPVVEEEVETPVQKETWITKDEFNYTMTQILDEWGCEYYYHEYDGINSVEFQVSEHVRIMAYLKDDNIHVSRLSIFTTTGYDEDEYLLALNLFDIAISGFTNDVEKVEEIKETIISEYGYTDTDNFGYEYKIESNENISIKIAPKF